jgi:mannose-6-phosphate isomerase-like protein (cupin superfamily)
MYNPVACNIEELTLGNVNYREVIFTYKYSQLVVMSIPPNVEIGEEVHTVDQFIRIEKGLGKAVVNGTIINISDGVFIAVPAGTRHNIINSGAGDMKLYTIYSPPNEPVGLVQQFKS